MSNNLYKYKYLQYKYLYNNNKLIVYDMNGSSIFNTIRNMFSCLNGKCIKNNTVPPFQEHEPIPNSEPVPKPVSKPVPELVIPTTKPYSSTIPKPITPDLLEFKPIKKSTDMRVDESDLLKHIQSISYIIIKLTIILKFTTYIYRFQFNIHNNKIIIEYIYNIYNNLFEFDKYSLLSDYLKSVNLLDIINNNLFNITPSYYKRFYLKDFMKDDRYKEYDDYNQNIFILSNEHISSMEIKNLNKKYDKNDIPDDIEYIYKYNNNIDYMLIHFICYTKKKSDFFITYNYLNKEIKYVYVDSINECIQNLLIHSNYIHIKYSLNNIILLIYFFQLYLDKLYDAVIKTKQQICFFDIIEYDLIRKLFNIEDNIVKLKKDNIIYVNLYKITIFCCFTHFIYLLNKNEIDIKKNIDIADKFKYKIYDDSQLNITHDSYNLFDISDQIIKINIDNNIISLFYDNEKEIIIYKNLKKNIIYHKMRNSNNQYTYIYTPESSYPLMTSYINFMYDKISTFEIKCNDKYIINLVNSVVKDFLHYKT